LFVFIRQPDPLALWAAVAASRALKVTDFCTFPDNQLGKLFLIKMKSI
jgi:hypothetical protein